MKSCFPRNDERVTGVKLRSKLHTRVRRATENCTFTVIIVPIIRLLLPNLLRTLSDYTIVRNTRTYT